MDHSLSCPEKASHTGQPGKPTSSSTLGRTQDEFVQILWALWLVCHWVPLGQGQRHSAGSWELHHLKLVLNMAPAANVAAPPDLLAGPQDPLSCRNRLLSRHRAVSLGMQANCQGCRICRQAAGSDYSSYTSQVTLHLPCSSLLEQQQCTKYRGASLVGPVAGTASAGSWVEPFGPHTIQMGVQLGR